MTVSVLVCACISTWEADAKVALRKAEVGSRGGVSSVRTLVLLDTGGRGPRAAAPREPGRGE